MSTNLSYSHITRRLVPHLSGSITLVFHWVTRTRHCWNLMWLFGMWGKMMELENGGAAEIQDNIVPTQLHATCCSPWMMGQVTERYGMPVSHMIFPKLDFLPCWESQMTTAQGLRWKFCFILTNPTTNLGPDFDRPCISSSRTSIGLARYTNPLTSCQWRNMLLLFSLPNNQSGQTYKDTMLYCLHQEWSNADNHRGSTMQGLFPKADQSWLRWSWHF